MLPAFFSYFVLFQISQKQNLIIVYKLHAGHVLQLLSELNLVGHERSTRDVTLSGSDFSLCLHFICHSYWNGLGRKLGKHGI